MAQDIAALVLQMNANLSRFEKSMAGMRATADKRLTEVERRALKADKNLSRIMSQAGQNMVGSLKTSLGAIAPTLAAAFSAQQVIRYADSYTNLQNQLRSTGLAGQDLKRVEDALYETANRNGVQIDATAQLYTRAALSRKSLGASEGQLLALVSGTTAALRVQGVSAEQASGPLLQLGQALGGGKIQAEEFNSLIDGLPVLLQAAASGSTRFGGDIGKLREAVKAGEVSSKEFFAALLAGFPALEAQAASATQTVGQALTNLNNQLGRFVGQTDTSLSATARLAQGINLLADNLDTVTLVVGILAAVAGTKLVLSLTAGSGAMIAQSVAAARLTAFQIAMTASMTGTTRAALVSTTAMRGFTAALVANPIGAVTVAVAALATGLLFLAQAQSDAAVATRAQARVQEESKGAATELEGLIKKLTGANDADTASIRRNIAALIDRQRLYAQMKRNEFLEAKAEDRARVTRLYENADRYGLSDPIDEYGRTIPRPGVMGPNGNPVDVSDTSETQTLRAVADAADAAVDSMLQTVAAATEVAGATTPTSTGSGGGGGRSGPSPEELAAQREMLRLQGDLARAQAEGRENEARGIQRQIDLINLTKTYTDAGVENAADAARTQVAALAAAEDIARELDKGEEAAQRRNDRRQRSIDYQRAAQDRQNEDLLDELNLRSEIARLSGDAAGLRGLEREELIQSRVNDLLRDKVGLITAADEAAARSQATNEVDQLDAAGIIGGLGGREDPAAVARAMYEEVDALRQQDLLSESEAAQRRAQINAQYNEARLSNTRSMLDLVASLQNSSNKKLAALGKAAAIAQATIDGVLAVQKALASAPPPMNFIQAAIVGAVAAANVASIAGMADGGMVRGTGGPRQDNQLRRLSVGEFVNNAASVRKNLPYLEAANAGADLSKLIPGLANGGLIGTRVPTISSAPGASAGTSITFAPTIDARGADTAAVRRLEQVLDEQRRSFANDVNSVRERRAKYRKGGR